MNNVAYNANDQMTNMDYGDDWASMMVSESRGYNRCFS